MIALFFSSVVTLFFLIISGVSVTKILRIPSSFTEKILLGLVFSNTVVTFLSLFFPINFFIVLLLFTVCAFGAFFLRKELKLLGGELLRKKSIFLWALPFIGIAFIIALGRPMNYDTGLYHLQSIKWIEEYAVIPGLANLHGRFGFNPNIFTFFSLISLRDIFGQEIFSVNFTLFSILVVYCIDTLRSLFRTKGISNMFLFLFSVLYITLLLRHNLSTPSPDFLIAAVSLFIFVRMLDISRTEKTVHLGKYIPILILSVYLVTVKLSALPIMLLCIFIFVRTRSELKKSLWIVLGMVFILLPWLIRNIILTGWLIYPFPSLDVFNFDWQVPLNMVMSERDFVIGWARNPGTQFTSVINLSLLDWFPIWWQRMTYNGQLFFLSSLAFPIIALIGQWTRKITLSFAENAVIVTSFCGVLFWFFMAPDWRFGVGFLAVASLSPLLFLRFSWVPSKKSTLIFRLFMLSLIGLFAFCNQNILTKNFYDIFFSQSALITPRKLSIPKDITFQTYTIHGVTISVPSGRGGECFNHSIPCTPYLNSALRLRGETVKSGFTLSR